MEDAFIDEKEILDGYEPEMALLSLIIELLERMDLETLAEKSEIEEERLEKYLALDGNPTLSDIKKLARVAGKKLSLSFVSSPFR